MANRDPQFTSQVNSCSVRPLLSWVTVAEERRIKLVQDEKKASSALAEANRDADKLRLGAMNLWQELIAARREHSKESSEKSSKKLAKSKDAARKEFARFDSTKEVVVMRNHAWQSEALPTLLTGLEDLERERLAMLKTVLSAFASQLRESDGPDPQPITLSDGFAGASSACGSMIIAVACASFASPTFLRRAAARRTFDWHTDTFLHFE